MSQRTEIRPKRLLLIDDDPVASGILLLRIRQECPLLDISVIHEPVAPPGYDLYVVDLNIAAHQDGMRLAESIAVTMPAAQVFLLSSYLAVPVLKRAIGVSCAGAFDKREPDDVAALLRAIATAAAHVNEAEPPPRRNLLRDMTALIREWNRRISAEQTRSP